MKGKEKFPTETILKNTVNDSIIFYRTTAKIIESANSEEKEIEVEALEKQYKGHYTAIELLGVNPLIDEDLFGRLSDIFFDEVYPKGADKRNPSLVAREILKKWKEEIDTYRLEVAA